MGRLDDFLASQFDICPQRKVVYAMAVGLFNRLGGCGFEDVFLDRVVVLRVLGEMERAVAASTWNTYLGCLKRFARWLQDPEGDELPKLWKKVKEKKIDWDSKIKNKWLGEAEFWSLLNVVDNIRDKAMMCVCVAGALRIDELLQLRVGDVKASSAGFLVTVSGKTGTRTFAMSLFAPALSLWLQHHPKRDDLTAFLWVRKKPGLRGLLEPIGYVASSKMLKKYVARANLGKRVTWHWLRHTKITWTYRRKDIRVNDEQARRMFGWRDGSVMPSRYAHITGVDTVDTFLALDGVKEVTRKIEEPSCLTPKKCLGCGEVNLFDALFCKRCGLPLSQEEAERILEKSRKLERAYELLEGVDFEELLKRRKKD